MKHPNPAPRPALETLEDRRTPTSYVSPADGDLYVVGNDNPNSVIVRLEFSAGAPFYTVEEGTKTWHPAVAVWGGDVRFYGHGGNDFFRNDTWLHAVAYGGNDSDSLVGGPNTDWLDGGNGTDYLFGKDGNDTLLAGFDTSPNQLQGGNGNDLLLGGYGSDTLYGEAGNDKLVGSLGRDFLFGGDDDDTLDGSDDGFADVLVGGPGHDAFQTEWAGGPTWFGNRDTPVDFDIWTDSSYDNLPPPA